MYIGCKMKASFLIIALLVSSVSSASSLSGTKVTKLMNDRSYNEYTFVQVERTPERENGHCSINTMWDYVLKTDDQFGRQMHAQLLAAFAAGKTVTLSGTDACEIGSTETLRRIEIY